MTKLKLQNPQNSHSKGFSDRVELQAAGQEAAAKGFSDWDQSGEAALEYIANPLSRVFGVSGRVIEKRITKERLWPLQE
jgi:hypothetical protein